MLLGKLIQLSLNLKVLPIDTTVNTLVYICMYMNEACIYI